MQSLDALLDGPDWSFDVASDLNIESEVTEADAFEGLLSQVSPRRAEALRLLYGEDHTRTQAAAEMGITYDTVGFLRRLGEKALREQLGAEDQGQPHAEE